jgi:glycosyltransferase involved in cell wall biosynthesis
MKIAQVVCIYPPDRGGIGTSALETARVLTSAGHKVDTFTIDYGSAAGIENAVRLKALPRIGNGGFLPQIFWRTKGYELVYLHYPFFGAAEAIWFLKRFFWKDKVKLAIHFHMEPEFSSPLLRILSLPSRLIEPDLFKEADLIICASRDYAEASLPAKIWSRNESKIKEIPFGVDTKRFQPVFKEDDLLPYLATAEPRGTIFKILFVGGLDKAHYFKGIDVLLDSLGLLDKASNDWQLEIVGGGKLQSYYEERARQLGVAEKVVFAGSVSDGDLPGKFQAADCLVLPSINRGEAFGIVLLEAMAAGLPVIASSLPGVRKVFTDGREGLLAKPGDAADLKEKIKFLLENPARRAEMGRAARKLAEEKYSSEKVSAQLIRQSVFLN